jgi:hypothetical protein
MRLFWFRKRDAEKRTDGDVITVEGSKTDRTAIGRGASVNISGSPETRITQNDLAAVREEFESLRAKVIAQQLGERQEEALRKVEQLEGAIKPDNIDTKTVGEVRNWFATYAPAVAGAVVGVLASPPVGALVLAAGTAAGAAYKKAAGI